MLQALVGIKKTQTQKFLENGRRIPVTEISMADNAVLQVKTAEKEKYAAVQVGLGAKKHATKGQLGHAKKAKLNAAPAFVKEVKTDDAELPAVGDMVAVDAVFKPGDFVDVTGTSKGKGFAGVVKRHGFRGGPKTHGQSDRLRAPGSIGQTTTPGRVYRGKRMAGHMGVDTVTVKNLQVVDVDAANKTLYLLGLVPGNTNGFVVVTRTGEENKKFVPLLKEQDETPVEAASAVEESAPAEETPVAEAAGPAEEVKEVTSNVEAEPNVTETPGESVETASTAAPVVEEKAESNLVVEESLENTASDAVDNEEKGEATSNVADEKKEETK